MLTGGEAAFLSFWNRPEVTCTINQFSQTVEDKSDEVNYNLLYMEFNGIKNFRYRLQIGNVDIETAELNVLEEV